MDRILITGSSKGIGRAIAAKFAEEGFSPVLHGRSKVDCILSLQEVWSVSKTNATFFLADLMKKAEIQRLIDQVRQENIRGVILNAGSYFPEQGETDGIENTLLINYVSRFILLDALLPDLRKKENSFIIDVSGKYHRKGDPDVIFMGKDKYDWQAQVAASKWANVTLMAYLKGREENKGIKIMSWHPGAVRSEAILNDDRLRRKDKLLYKAMAGFFIPPAKAAENLFKIFPKKEWTLYAEEDHFAEPDPRVQDREMQKRLIEWTRGAIGSGSVGLFGQP